MLSHAIKYLYPTAIEQIDFRLEDRSDGNGVFIRYWNTAKLGALPTQQALDAAIIEVTVIIDAEDARKAGIDQAIANDSTIQSLKAMSNSALDDWWAANVTNAAQAIQVLKRIARIVLRKLL
jgi:hypothetical protein